MEIFTSTETMVIADPILSLLTKDVIHQESKNQETSRFWEKVHGKNYSTLNWSKLNLKGVLAKHEQGYRLNAIKKRFWSLLILLLFVDTTRRKLLKTTNTEELSVNTNSEHFLYDWSKIITFVDFLI